MTTERAERIRLLELLGEAMHAWCRSRDRLHWLNPFIHTDESFADLMGLMSHEHPTLYKTLFDLKSDEDVSYVFAYATARNLVHAIKQLRPQQFHGDSP